MDSVEDPPAAELVEARARVQQGGGSPQSDKISVLIKNSGENLSFGKEWVQIRFLRGKWLTI